jgi:GNAT superfamily N-acetyltransferase
MPTSTSSSTSALSFRSARAADVPALARVRTESWHAAYRGIIPPRELAKCTPSDNAGRMQRAVANRRDGRGVLVAENDRGVVIGYVWYGPQLDRALRFSGEIYELYIHPRWQRCGAGMLLLSAAIWRLVDRELNPVMLWVLAENEARFFYEACGGVEVGRRGIVIGGRRLTKLAFGWRDALPLPVYAPRRRSA